MFSPSLFLLQKLCGPELSALAKSSARAVCARFLIPAGPLFFPLSPALSELTSLHGEQAPSREQTLALCCFPLRMRDEKEQLMFFLHVCQRARTILFLDFKIPERNLEWPAWLLFSPFRYRIEPGGNKVSGGLEAFLYKKCSHVRILSRHTLCLGGLCAILTETIADN